MTRRREDALPIGRLLFPALRWEPAGRFQPAGQALEAVLELGVGGFIVFGGPASAAAALIADLRARSREPLLVGADLERGAGQQFAGAGSLPPAAALGALDDLVITRRAGELTGREARAIGVDWVFAPVADLDAEPANPIVGTRAFGADPGRVAAHVTAWIEGCREGGALSCAKHFPGHGRTTADSHLALPVVDASRDALEGDLLPFRAAIRQGVDSVMTAHVAYPALDPSDAPATLSEPIVTGLLRRDLGHAGLVVTDALNMAGVLGNGADEGRAAVAALAAGCDALLHPADVAAVIAAVRSAAGRTLPESRLRAAAARVDAAARRMTAAAVPSGAAPGWGRADDRAWALEVALRSLHVARGRPALAGEVDLVTVDDDLGGPFAPPPRTYLPAALAAVGFRVTEAARTRSARPALVALYADIRGWKGRPGLSPATRERLRRLVTTRPDATVVLFGHPRLGSEVPGEAVLAAWGGDAVMQEAVACWLAGPPSR